MEGWILCDKKMAFLELVILPPNNNIDYIDIQNIMQNKNKKILLVYNLKTNSCRFLLMNPEFKETYYNMKKDKVHLIVLKNYDLDSPCYYFTNTDKLKSHPVILPETIKTLVRKNLNIK